MWTYRARLAHLVDADTFDLTVDVGFRVTVTDRFRLAWADAFEIRGPERPRGLAAVELVRDWWPPDGEVLIQTFKARGRMARGKFGRWLAEVHHPQRLEPLHEALIEAGLAVRVDEHGRRV